MLDIAARGSRLLTGLILRFIKRSFILLIGIALAYIITWKVFPALNQQFSVAVAVMLTYGVSAYILIPTGIRLSRFGSKTTNHIPLYNKTTDGFSCDPVNIGFVGTKYQIETAMKKAGWEGADSLNFWTATKMGFASLLGRAYPRAPFSTLYLFGRAQDLSFQIQPHNNPRQRHHVRFWAVSQDVAPEFKREVRFWRHKIKLKKNAKLLWVGAATYETGIGFVRFHGQFAHSMDPDTNAERDYIIKTLEDAEVVKDILEVRAGKSMEGKALALGSKFISDGELKICVLS